VRAHLPDLLRGRSGPEARNLLREYLQATILASLQRSGAMIPLAFHGGTALRFLHSIRRYSEDLDFALERPEAGYAFRGYVERIRRDLDRDGYRVEIARVSDSRTVHSAFVKLPGLLYELELSGHPTQAIAVKLEVDTRPPAGALTTTTVLRRHVLLQLQHHDRASLLAGKLHAVLQRPYPKGRDFYDLMWYLADATWPEPNLTMLNNALRQTGWEGSRLTADTWRHVVADRIASIDLQRIAEDVRPLLESAEELPLLRRETLLRLLSARRD
jgi:hypothetical protein